MMSNSAWDDSVTTSFDNLESPTVIQDHFSNADDKLSPSYAGTGNGDSVNSDNEANPQNDSFNFSDNDNDFAEESHDNNSTPCESTSEVYLQACKRYKRIACSRIQKGLLQTTLSCRYQLLHPLDVRAICCALCKSWKVERIDFEHNELGSAGAKVFYDVVYNTSYITHIRIANNKVGSQGVKAICEAVQSNRTVSMLDLSGNNIVERDGVYFQKLIEESDALQELYLANNELMQEGVEAIAKALTYTSSLKVLDLKWNHIRLQGARAIGKAIRYNASLEKLDLSWNGLHMDGSEAIGKGLPKNDILLEVNISNNRLDEKCFAFIMQGLKGNCVLQRLVATHNNLTSKGAKTIITELKKYTNSGLRFLDLGSLEVTDSFVKEYKELRNIRDIKIMYGLVWKEDRAHLFKENDDTDAALLRCNPLIVIMKCIRLQKFRLIDIFRSMDKNRDNLLSVDEFCEGLMQLDVPLSKPGLHSVMKMIDTDGNGHINFIELLEAQKVQRAIVQESYEQDLDLARAENGRLESMLSQIINKGTQIRRSSLCHEAS